VGKAITEEKRITPGTEERLTQALDAFMASWQ